jgi:predicted RNA binding protein YcfA (HicA-like mRNA interferase family)
MTEFGSAKARRVLKALERTGWTVKRQTGSHKTLAKAGFPDLYLPFMMATKSDQGCWCGLPNTPG